jgi:CheY-like chemotaxis protein
MVKERNSGLGRIPFRLIFMDLNMPEMNGKEATKVLRQMNARNEIDLS